MHEVLEEKYKQVPGFHDTWSNSGRTFPVEATGDEFWGVGLWNPMDNTQPLSEIKGRNIQGWMLMALRDVKSGVGLGPLQTLYQIHRGEPF